MPKVSVILPVYQREQYLGIAIEGIVAQTFQDFEVIVSDNSAKDSLRKICESFECHGRLRYRSNPRNLGAALNIRAAVSESKGIYVTILNDDDCWEPTFLEKLVSSLEKNPNCVLAFSDHWIMDAQGKIDVAATDANTKHYGRAELPAGDVKEPVKFVLEKNGVPQMAALFRRDALDLSLLTEQVIWAYDFWISCILAASGNAFYHVPERLTRYRVHGEMETARKSPDKSEPMIYIFEQLLNLNWFPLMRGFLEQRLAVAYYSNGRDLLWFDQPAAARRMFRKALRLSWHQKSMAAFALSLAPLPIRRHLQITK